MRKAGILLGAGLVAFVLIEVLLRWMQAPALDYYRKIKLLHVYHPDYFVALPANEDLYVKHHDGLWEGRFTTNSMGLRGSPEPDPSASKILCLGDSLVMGFGVSDDQTFCSRLQQYSSEGAFEQKYQFMNIGVDAFGSMGSALRIEDMVPRMKKVRAILFVISPNDFVMPETLAARGLEPDDIKDERRMNDPGYAFSFWLQFQLTRYSYALHAAKLAYENLLIKRSITENSLSMEIESAGLKGDDAPNWNRTLDYTISSFRGPVRDRCNYMKPAAKEAVECPEPVPPTVSCSDSPPPLSELEPLPEFTQKAYDRMIAYTKKHNVQLIPVILPVQVEELYCHNQGKYHPLGNYALRATDYFEKRGVRVMQLLPSAPSMCSPKHGIADHFIPGDGHLTDLGNRWAAQSIKERLDDMLRKGGL
ncbi:MAG: lipase [Leptospiraceae bacterium]|nr:lipase [Leptospiraceae bacterium]